MPIRYPSDRRHVPGVETTMQDGFSADKAFLALQRAIIATFDDAQWHELGYIIGKHDLITGHQRLLRSLHWGDEDYGGSVFNILPRLLGERLENLKALEDFVHLPEWLKRNDQTLYAELYGVEAPSPIVPLEQVEEASTIYDVVELNRHAARIRHGIVNDPEQAIGSAKELLETVLKTIIGDHNHTSNNKIPDLLKKARTALDLDPNAVTEKSPAATTVRRTLSNLGQIVTGVAEVRNLHGTGHGRSKTRQLEIAHARLVVNAAVSIATFLLEVWQDRNSAVS